MTFNMRITEDEKQKIEAKAKQNGFTSVSTYVKYVAINAIVTVKATIPSGK